MTTSSRFKITYPSGLGHHVEVCDAQTIEEFANRHFGSVDYKEQGVKVEMEPYVAEADEPEAAEEVQGIPSAVKSSVSPDQQDQDDDDQTDEEDD